MFRHLQQIAPRSICRIVDALGPPMFASIGEDKANTIHSQCAGYKILLSFFSAKTSVDLEDPYCKIVATMQTTTPINPPVPSAVPAHAEAGSLSGYLGSWEFILSCEVLLFGIIVLLILFVLFRKREATPDDILKTLAVVLVIIGSLFTMTAGFSSAQIAPIIGLFGTIVGYIIGRRSDAPADKNASGQVEKEGT